MSVRVNINGTPYDGFTKLTVKRSFSNFANGFSFTSVWSTNKEFPIEVQDRCSIFLNDTQVINGFVESVQVEYDNGSHVITIEGRDRTCDLIDSSVSNAVIFNPPITLRKVIQNSLNLLGITGMDIIENVSIAPFSKTEVESASIGETFFSFLNRLCHVRQVVLTTDGKGNILLDRASKNQINTVLLGKIGNSQNNVKKSSSRFDFTKRLYKYTAYSQGNMTTFVDIPQSQQQITSQKGSATDSVVRTTRQSNFIAEKAVNSSELTKRATWECNLRRADSKVYSCVVQGFSAQQDGFIWRPNLLVKVDDDFAKTSGLFLIKDVTYNLELGKENGEQTELSLVVQDAFTVQAELDQALSRTNPQGKTFVV